MAQIQSSLTPEQKIRRRLFWVAFILICINLRPAFIDVDVLLNRIESTFHISALDSGYLGVIPIFLLGIAAPMTPKLCKYIYPERVITISLIISILGIIIRSHGGLMGLALGMFILGLGLGVAGACLPGIIKRRYPLTAAFMMTVFTSLMCTGSSLGAALGNPIIHLTGTWEGALEFWAIPLIIALVAWFIYDKAEGRLYQKTIPETVPTVHTAKINSIMKDSRAWFMATFYIARVSGNYLLVIWMPLLLISRGVSGSQAGFILSVGLFTQIFSTILTQWTAKKMGGYTHVLIFCILTSIIGCYGLIFLPLQFSLIFSILFGMSIGFVFSLGMILIVEKAKTPIVSIRLSSMIQGFGFTLGGLLALIGGYFITPDKHIYFFLTYLLYASASIITGYFCIKLDPIE